MPSLPMTYCKQPGCGAKVKRGYCPLHRQQRQRYWKTERDPDLVALYNSSLWKRTRVLKLSMDPQCEACRFNAATEVDHKQSIRSGGDPFDLDNLRSLCKGCHSRKTVRRDGGLGRRRR